MQRSTPATEEQQDWIQQDSLWRVQRHRQCLKFFVLFSLFHSGLRSIQICFFSLIPLNCARHYFEIWHCGDRKRFVFCLNCAGFCNKPIRYIQVRPTNSSCCQFTTKDLTPIGLALQLGICGVLFLWPPDFFHRLVGHF